MKTVAGLIGWALIMYWLIEINEHLFQRAKVEQANAATVCAPSRESTLEPSGSLEIFSDGCRKMLPEIEGIPNGLRHERSCASYLSAIETVRSQRLYWAAHEKVPPPLVMA